MNIKKIYQDIMFYSFLFIIIGTLIFMSIMNERKQESKEIYGVHIKGEVNAPGYYELEEGSRYKDAILAAGGETTDADLDSINLATKLLDGETILVPSTGNQNTSSNNKININTADLYQLCKLDGFGETTSQRIIDYRAKNGAFSKIEDLMKVDGIGSSKFNKIKDLITI